MSRATLHLETEEAGHLPSELQVRWRAKWPIRPRGATSWKCLWAVYVDHEWSPALRAACHSSRTPRTSSLEGHGPNLATQLCKLQNCRYSDWARFRLLCRIRTSISVQCRSWHSSLRSRRAASGN